MPDLAAAFVYLEADAQQIDGTRLLTRPVGASIEGIPILVALDSQHQRHLLVPAGGRPVVADHSSQGVNLSARVLQTGDEPVTFIDIHCRIQELDLVFERLAEDVITRLGHEDVDPGLTCARVLDDWRTLLRSAAQPLGREEIQGLVGELEVMKELARVDPLRAVQTWKGPSGALHDFVSGPAALEVKTTASPDGNFVTITGIDQLDPSQLESLALAVVHLRESGDGITIDERIDELVAMGVPRGSLLEKVGAAGFVYESGADADLRFEVRSLRVWRVGPGFPGLRRSELEERRLRGVAKIRYELALDSAPPRVRDEDVAALVEEWCRTP